MAGRKPRPYPTPDRRSDPPLPAFCPTCAAPILVGWINENVIAVDAPTLNLVGEVNALLAGLRTYEVSGFGIARRLAEIIKMIPSPVITDVHRQHRCGIPPVRDDEKGIPRPTPHYGFTPPF